MLRMGVYEVANHTNIKDSNPKDVVGVRKVPMSPVPSGVLMELGLAMLEGARKYGRHNYRAVGIRSSVYYDAAMRHLMAWWEGEELDPGSGISHLTKAISTLVVIRDAQMVGKVEDDRPPPLAAGWIEELNQKAGEIIDSHLGPKEPFLASRDAKERSINAHKITCGVYAPVARSCDCGAGDSVPVQVPA
jgi:hypothetical protein